MKSLRYLVSVITAAASISLGLAGAPMVVSPASAQAGCSDVVLIGARGSGELAAGEIDPTTGLVLCP